jgi:hypothetical protein
LAAVLVVLCAALILQFVNLQRSPFLRFHGIRPPDILRNRQPLTVNDINMIQPWMTFDYLNHVFNLPPDYLKTKLAVSDTRYPRLSLAHFIQNNHLDSNSVMAEVKRAISDFLNGKK